MTKGRILVIRGGAIGDFVLTLPVFAALRKHFPSARIEVMGYPWIADLARLGGHVDAVRSIESRALAGFFSDGMALDPKTAAYFEPFDVILSYLFDPDRVFEGNIGRCSGARFIAGPHRPDEAGGLHASVCLLKPLEQLAIFDADPVPRMALGDGRAARGSDDVVSKSGKPGADAASEGPLGGLEVAIHPGSGSERKNWPESRWLEFLTRLADLPEVRVLLVGGEAEGDRLDRLAGGVGSERIELARGVPLTELAVRMSRCAFFLGHDSGITHLAAALGMSCLVLWGSTSEAVWRPMGSSVQILRHAEGLAHLTVEAVWTGWERVREQAG